jgi:hypothetical protein
MSIPRRNAPAPPVAPASTPKPRRKRCRNCNGLMTIGQGGRSDRKVFCGEKDPGKGKCKDEFHQHGSAFGPLKTRLEKLVTKLTNEKFAELQKEIEKLNQRIRELEYPMDPLT